jgi:ATP-dependent Zn protease
MFKQTKKSGGLDDLAVLYKKPEESEGFTCTFAQEGNYLVELRKEEFKLDRTKSVLRLSQYNVIVKAKKEEKKDDKEDKEKKNEPATPKKEETGSNNTVFIIVIVILVLIIIGFVAGLLYLRYKRKQNTTKGLMGSDNSKFSF